MFDNESKFTLDALLEDELWKDVREHLSHVYDDNDMLTEWQNDKAAFVSDLTQLAQASYADGYNAGLEAAVEHLKGMFLQ